MCPAEHPPPRPLQSPRLLQPLWQPVWPSRPSLLTLGSSGGVPPSNTTTFKPKLLSKDHRYFILILRLMKILLIYTLYSIIIFNL